MSLKPMSETGRGDSGVFWNYANSKAMQGKTHPGDAVDGNHCFFLWPKFGHFHRLALPQFNAIYRTGITNASLTSVVSLRFEPNHLCMKISM